MFEIEIVNQQAAHPVNEALLRHAVESTLRLQQVSAAQLVIAVVTDAAIHIVNRDHLGHDYPTDVISFLYDEAGSDDSQSKNPRGRGKRIDGELVVSIDTAHREAPRFGWSTDEELALYVVHGLLHLCGYDDLSDEEEAEMRSQERAALELLGISPRAAGDGDEVPPEGDD